MDDVDGQLVSGLFVFVAVADAGGFGKAAERLGITQSGVSRAIARWRLASAPGYWTARVARSA